MIRNDAFLRCMEVDMGTISINGLEPEMEKVLKEQAKMNNKSLSSFLKDIIKKYITVNRGSNKNQHRFEKYCGKWTEKEYEEFCSATKDFEKINPEDWK